MNQEKALEIVNALTYGLQRARSTASREEVEALAAGMSVDDEIVDNVLQGIMPWLHGPEAEALLLGLVNVSERGLRHRRRTL